MPKTALEHLGPSLTSSLAQYLCVRDGIGPQAARKRIERALEAKQITSLQTMRFAHNQSFVALPEHFGTRLYHERLFQAMQDANSSLRLPLAAIRARSGSIPEHLFAVYAGCPIASEKRQNADAVMQKLLELKILRNEQSCLHLSTIARADRISDSQMQAAIAVEDVLLTTFGQWLKQQRLIGAQQSKRGDEEIPQFGYYAWDFVAPSYVAPLATKSKTKATPGFIVADVILGRVLNEYEVQYFIEKANNIRYLNKHRPFMAFLLADWFEPDALTLAQANGVIFTTPKNLFGRHLSEALEQFRKILAVKDQELERQAKEISKLLEATQSSIFLEALNENMRGKLFELMVGHCFVKMYNIPVQLGRKFKDPQNKEFDCDVLQLSPNIVLRACECKGYRKEHKVTLDDVKKWFVKVAAVVRTHYSAIEYPEQEFSLWTSGEFEDDALQWLRKFSSDCRKFAVSSKSGDELSALVQKVGDPTMKEVHKRWFTPEQKKDKGEEFARPLPP